ncbi:hypothetical protein SAMN02910456_01446 [Ruminococcaceae bacterium YRB3002]|nr:hypothetical protein SAMN02910456_01446 [Ruminococcaceae bacterium YRB3002]
MKEAARNPKRKIECKMSFLWYPELARIRDECLKYKYAKFGKSRLRAKIIEKIDENKLDLIISRELFDRDYTQYQ